MSALTFLVVDDFESMRKVTSNQLVSLGHSQIFTAKDGVQALKVLRAEAIDVVISDWNMPVMDGLAFIKHVRARADLRDVSLVMVTTESEQANIVRALAAGAHEYVIKPFVDEAIAEKLALLGLMAA